MQAEWHSCIVAVKMLKRSDEIAMNDFRTELDVLQKVTIASDYEPSPCVLPTAAGWQCTVMSLAETDSCVVCLLQWFPSSCTSQSSAQSCAGCSEDHEPTVCWRQACCQLLRACAQMHHPNTVQFLGACTRKQPFMIITEYMPGGSLADLLRRPSSFPSMRRAIVMAIDCARAMTYLHLLECVLPIPSIMSFCQISSASSKQFAALFTTNSNNGWRCSATYIPASCCASRQGIRRKWREFTPGHRPNPCWTSGWGAMFTCS